MSCGNRRVGGEDAELANGFEILVGRSLERSALQLLFEQGHSEQRGVALVHVVDERLIVEGGKDAHSAHAQHRFLPQAVIAVASVEVVGQPAVARIVFLKVGVEEIDGDGVAGDALEVITPGADGDGAILDGYSHDRRFGGEDAFRAPGLRLSRLNAFGIEVLTEVSEAMREGYGDQRQAHVCRGAQGVACEHAETTAIGRYRRADGDFHRKIGNQAIVAVTLQ